MARIVLSYNLGAMYWTWIGNGEKARHSYLMTVEYSQAEVRFKNMPIKKMLYANACENLMHLSLSYEEYLDWAERLRSLQPDDDIFRGQVSGMIKMRDKGHSWSHAIESIAQCCYNRNDPALDQGRYGNAASTFQLLLKNRRSLRLSRDDWRRIVYEYGALILRMTSDHIRKAKRFGTAFPLDEVLFIVEDAMPLIHECVEAHPGDTILAKLWADCQGFIHTAQTAPVVGHVKGLNGTDDIGDRFRMTLSSVTVAALFLLLAIAVFYVLSFGLVVLPNEIFRLILFMPGLICIAIFFIKMTFISKEHSERVGLRQFKSMDPDLMAKMDSAILISIIGSLLMLLAWKMPKYLGW